MTVVSAVRLSLVRRAVGPVALAGALVGSAGCLEPPSIGAAAAPSEAKGGMVWRSPSTNKQVAETAKFLERVFDGKASPGEIDKRLQKELAGLSPDERARSEATIRERYQSLATMVKEANGKVLTGPLRDMMMARFYYSEKRFIEAATHLSQVLDAQPDFPEARNLLARCFFFLGNPDRTIREADYRQRELKAFERSRKLTPQEDMELLDALYLIGAVVSQSPGISQSALLQGKAAWQEYLRRTPKSPSRKQVEEGLAEIEQALRGEGRLARMEVRRAQAGGGGGGGVMGGRPSGAGGPMAAKNPQREKNLKPNATPFERAEARALDALDMRDLAKANTLLDDAQRISPNQPSILVGKARLMVLQGNAQGGVRAYGEIIKRFPDYSPAWHYLGMAHLMNRDPKQAAQAWETLMKKDPAYAKANSLDRRLQVAKRMSGG